MHLSHLAFGHRPVIAIIGGGASGTLTAIHLLRLAAAGRPIHIALIDRDGRHGLGQAYATTHPRHLLNSPADTMSAVAGDPGHLLRWAGANAIAHDWFLRPVRCGRARRHGSFTARVLSTRWQIWAGPRDKPGAGRPRPPRGQARVAVRLATSSPQAA